MVTVIIVNYFSALICRRAALSVLSGVPDAQIIVVDNSNNTQETEKLSSCLPSVVKCIVNDENIGFGRACNQGFALAVHDLILLLNPDAYVQDGCLGALIEFLQHTPQAGAVAPRVYWDKEQTWLLPPAQLPTPASELAMTLALRWPWFGERLSHRFRRWALRCNFASKPIKQRMLSGGLMLLRRNAIEAIGGLFDPDFFMYYEDTDLCQRLQKAGFSMFLLSAAHAVHEWCAAENKVLLSQPSHKYYFHKHYAGTRLSRWQARLEQSRLPIRISESCNLGVCNASPIFSVPAFMQQKWLLEVSLHPLMIPAVYSWGSGTEGKLPDFLWQRLGSGQFWARLSTTGHNVFQYFHWQIPESASNR